MYRQTSHISGELPEEQGRVVCAAPERREGHAPAHRVSSLLRRGGHGAAERASRGRTSKQEPRHALAPVRATCPQQTTRIPS